DYYCLAWNYSLTGWIF
nr:immunoglobulin light chain junction region [Macaca mulatta]